ncbi:MAG: hypothetical protein HY048_09045 [Acidobacteria bacterium]|nr:hypothetical protein [Acidobacteriota bacterium]
MLRTWAGREGVTRLIPRTIAARRSNNLALVDERLERARARHQSVPPDVQLGYIMLRVDCFSV